MKNDHKNRPCDFKNGGGESMRKAITNSKYSILLLSDKK